jgi:hypothetical protein
VAADFIRHAKPHPTAGVRKGIGCSRFHPAEHRQALTSCLALRMEKHAFKRPLESEGIPPLIKNPIYGILKHGQPLNPNHLEKAETTP